MIFGSEEVIFTLTLSVSFFESSLEVKLALSSTHSGKGDAVGVGESEGEGDVGVGEGVSDILGDRLAGGWGDELAEEEVCIAKLELEFEETISGGKEVCPWFSILTSFSAKVEFRAFPW